jgi:putative FmdB family regulatory protein
MPVYEYYCSSCNTKFEALRPMKDADVPIPCEACESRRTARVLSVFFAASKGGGDGEAVSLGGGGCGCGGHCACGHSHN